MKTHPLGPSELQSTRLIYGCMRIVGTWNPAEIDAARREQAFTALDAAWDAGYRHFDHADIYCRGGCESVFGQWLKDRHHPRDSMLITTKCGIRWAGDPDQTAPHRYDFSKEHILWSCEQSLQRLGLETIDLYLLHRPDLLMDPPEIAEAFDQLHREGKVRHFGVSNFTIPQLQDLQSSLEHPLVCNQIQLHPGRLAPSKRANSTTCAASTSPPPPGAPSAAASTATAPAPTMNTSARSSRPSTPKPAPWALPAPPPPSPG